LMNMNELPQIRASTTSIARWRRLVAVGDMSLRF
jgi:hypothetical protein